MIASAACPKTGKERPVALVCRLLGTARSSLYQSRRSDRVQQPAKRGPKTTLSDTQLLTHIKEVISSSPFTGEGYRKVRARLRRERGICASGKRVLRIMRANDLLSASRPHRKPVTRPHDGRITTQKPNQLWGADGTKVWTFQDGWCWVFSAVDHHSAKAWTHVVKIGDRHAALEPVLRAVKEEFGSPAKDIAQGTGVRHDNGSQYSSNDFQQTLRFLGLRSSPAFVCEPQCNGVAERFFRTLKEQCLWVECFETEEDARAGVAAFTELYNGQWLIEKNGHRTPDEVHYSVSKSEVYR